MSNYRRVKIEGAWYFFTAVAYHRFCRQGVYDDFDWDLFQTKQWDEQNKFLNNGQWVRYNGPSGLIRKGAVSICVGTAHPTEDCPIYPAVKMIDSIIEGG